MGNCQNILDGPHLYEPIKWGLLNLIHKENEASSFGQNPYLIKLMEKQPGPTYPKGAFFCIKEYCQAPKKCNGNFSGCERENCSDLKMTIDHCTECGDDWVDRRRLIELNQLDAPAPVAALAPTGVDSGTSLLWLVALIP